MLFNREVIKGSGTCITVQKSETTQPAHVIHFSAFGKHIFRGKLEMTPKPQTLNRISNFVDFMCSVRVLRALHALYVYSTVLFVHPPAHSLFTLLPAFDPAFFSYSVSSQTLLTLCALYVQCTCTPCTRCVLCVLYVYRGWTMKLKHLSF